MKSQNQRLDEINMEMLKEFKNLDIVDTPEHRLAFLTGLYDGWWEDSVEPELRFDKSLYMLTLSLEIARLKFRIRFPQYYS